MLAAGSPPQRWTPDLCFTCPVPDLLQANSCAHMVLESRVERPFPFIKRQVRVFAYCNKTHRDVPEPHIGCGECHPLPEVFMREIDEPDAAP